MTAHGRAIELPFPGPVALLDTGTEDLYMPPDVRPFQRPLGYADGWTGRESRLRRFQKRSTKCYEQLANSAV